MVICGEASRAFDGGVGSRHLLSCARIATMARYDWIIKSGRVIDPATTTDATLDVAIAGGRVAAIAEDLPSADGEQIYDASGQIVAPGLVDIHTHGYYLATPLGIDMDHYCLGRGVTTVVDAGSAGHDTFPGLRAYCIDRFRTRLLAFVNISRGGLSFAALAGGDAVGELESLKLLSEEACARTIDDNRDVCVGVKVRLTDSIANDGRNEAEGYRMAIAAARTVGLPLMVHHTFSTVPLESCPGDMANGDIYTHALHGFRSTLVQSDRSIHPSAVAARDNGVLFDVGHGAGAFSWTVAEACMVAGFAPDTISTDLHALCHEGPAYDLTTVMTKMLAVGMSLEEVVAASTAKPAAAIGWQGEIGSLQVGREADVVALQLDDVDVELEDSQQQKRRVRQRLRAAAVWRAGERAAVTAPQAWPNPRPVHLDTWRQLEIRDEREPSG